MLYSIVLILNLLIAKRQRTAERDLELKEGL